MDKDITKVEPTPNETDMEKEEWYIAMVEDCTDIITESSFTSRWAIVEGYHQLGERILKENDNFERKKIYGKEICSRVSESLGKSRQQINRAMQFFVKFPDLSKLPEGKNTSWHQIANKYLPGHIDEEEQSAEHEHDWKPYLRCTICRETKEVTEGEVVPSKQPTISQATQRELVEWVANLRNIKGFPNYAKQANAIHKCLQLGYTVEEIQSAAKKMKENPWWAEKGFDFMDIANQLPKLIKKEQVYDPTIKTDNPDWL